MACVYSSKWTIGCDRENNSGGIDKVYIGTYSGSTTYSTNSSDVITGATSAQTTYYEIEQTLGEAEWKVEGAHNENGNAYNNTLNLKFFKYQASLRTFVLTMAAANSTVILKDYSGKYFLFSTTPATLGASSFGAGKVMTDLNGGTVQLKAMSPKLPYEISSTYFATLTIV